MDRIAALETALLDRYRQRTAASRALYERAARVLPGGDTRTGTFHPPYPLFIRWGRGCRLRDEDGNDYLDFLGNFTSLIHGHGHPAVLAAMAAQAESGTAHGTANALQVRLAELVCQRVPSVERIRFCNSGTEATMGALRAARAFTGRPKVMKMEGGYHGSHDQVAVATAPPFDLAPAAGLSPGALGDVLLGRMNDLEHTASVIRRHRHELAAVIVEPLMGAAGCIPAEPAFLRGLREVTRECGVLLVLDEIITFRLGHGGVQGRLGLRPDLTCFGKILGGGLPVGAFGGAEAVMATFDPTRPGAVVHSGTFNGNAATMAAGIATLELFDAAAVDRLNTLGDGLRRALNGALAARGVEAQVTGEGSVMQLHFAAGPLPDARAAARGDRRRLGLMHLAMLTRGMFTPSRQMYVLCTPMGPAEVAAFTAAFDDALAALEPVLARAAAAAR